MAQKKASSKSSGGKSRTNSARSKTRGGTPAQRKAKPARSPRKKASPDSGRAFTLDLPQKALLVGIAIIFATAVLVLSLLSPNQGQLTAGLAAFMWRLFGWGGFAVPLITGGVGLYLVLWGMDQAPALPTYRLLGFALLFLVFEGFASIAAVLRDNGLSDFWQVARAQLGGGYLGGAVSYGLTYFVGNLGAIFTLGALGIVGAVLISGVTRADVGRLLHAAFGLLRRDADTAVPERQIRVNPDRQPPAPQSPSPRQLPLLAERPSPPAPPTAQAAATRPRGRRGRQAEEQPVPATAVAELATARRPRQPAPSWTLPAVAGMLEVGSDQDLNNAAIREQVEIIEHTLESFGAPATVVEINQGPTITQFGVEPGYLARGPKRVKVKVGKISSLADDLALALAARSIRIQAPVPGKGYVGIEVPNPNKALVSLRDVLESSEFGRIKSTLGLGLGQNVAGQPIVADLTQMPHLLIAGTTGSGKSVCVNSIIASLLLFNTPEMLKLVMVDPKRVELTGYNGIPHLAAPVVVEMDRVISTLQWALREMDRRYRIFAEVTARNITEYNKQAARRPDAEILPYVVIVIDELADLMMLAPEDTERAVTRLAQMARATGIHMVIATQRPSVDVVTGLIKANFPARIAFAVASGTDSRVILDSTGAERLLGQGDMLFQSPDAAAPLRLQGCFVSDVELNRLINYWKQARRFNLISAEAGAEPRAQAAPDSPAPVAMPAPPIRRPEPTAPPSSAPVASDPTPKPPKSTPPRASADAAASTPPPNPALRQQPLWEALQEEAAQQEYEDELMPEAIALVNKLGKASTSLLQRRFRIGYTRAARMIDAMETLGVIGPPTGTSKAREVLASEEADAAELAETDSEGEDSVSTGAESAS
jgi:DNA segregation ATPase FtsK/SpoIIIE, S-DNA-T family